MKTVHKSVLIWYSPEEMFSLVTGVEHYPQFLPWCDHAAVLEQTSEGMTAEVGIAFSGIRQTFVTRNTHEAGKRVQMHLVKGPFSRLDGDWHFHPVGDGTHQKAAAQERRHQAPDWQGRAKGLHAGTHQPALEERLREVRDRPGQRQGRARQARHHQRPRRQARGGARHEEQEQIVPKVAERCPPRGPHTGRRSSLERMRRPGPCLF